jgi:hypothetical protein
VFGKGLTHDEDPGRVADDSGGRAKGQKLAKQGHDRVNAYGCIVLAKWTDN